MAIRRIFATPISDPLVKPTAQIAAGLVSQPQPCQLNHRPAQAAVAGFRDALLHVDTAALPGARRQPGIGGDLTPIAELAIERFQGKYRGPMLRRRNSCGPGGPITAGSAVGRCVATSVSAWLARRIRSRSASSVAICEIIINSLMFATLSSRQRSTRIRGKVRAAPVTSLYSAASSPIIHAAGKDSWLVDLACQL